MDKGYKVSIQPMDTFSYSNENIQNVINIANEIHPETLSMVDTYSLASTEDIDRVYHFYEAGLNKNIKIGFHSHNNQLNSLALASALYENKRHRTQPGYRCVIVWDGQGRRKPEHGTICGIFK